MRRYAAHFIFVSGYGYFKQHVVEVEQGSARSVFPLTEEIEGVEWFPGVIALLDRQEVEVGVPSVFPALDNISKEPPLPFGKECLPKGLTPYLFYPFDFTTMQPVAGTRHKQLP